MNVTIRTDAAADADAYANADADADAYAYADADADADADAADDDDVHLCVSVEVNVSLLLDPSQGLPGRPLKEDIPEDKHHDPDKDGNIRKCAGNVRVYDKNIR